MKSSIQYVRVPGGKLNGIEQKHSDSCGPQHSDYRAYANMRSASPGDDVTS
jgi:hypothetical protein